MTVFLDTGPLGLITNPKRTSENPAVAECVYGMEAANHRLIVPAIADNEMRRELTRSGKDNGIAHFCYKAYCSRECRPIFAVRTCRPLDQYPPRIPS